MSRSTGEVVGVGPARSGVWFATPWLVGVVCLTLLPMAGSLALSFTAWDGLAFSAIEWVGLSNYSDALRIDREHSPRAGDPRYWGTLGGRPVDERFYKSLYNSFYYSLFAVPLGLVASLGLALLLNLPLRGIRFFRTLYYLPHVLGGVATILIWSWLFNPKFGPINAGLRGVYTALAPIVGCLGIDTAQWDTPNWLYSPASCKPALVLMHVWTAGGGDVDLPGGAPVCA